MLDFLNYIPDPVWSRLPARERMMLAAALQRIYERGKLAALRGEPEPIADDAAVLPLAWYLLPVYHDDVLEARCST